MATLPRRLPWGLAWCLWACPAKTPAPVDPSPAATDQAVGASTDRPLEAGPPPATDRPYTRVLLGSCYDQATPDGTWEALRAMNPDLYLAAGDNVYADVVKEGGRIRFVASIERVAQAYRQLHDDPAWARFQQAVPILPMWDDHDYGLNDAGEDLPFADASEALFLDFWQVPPDDPRRTRPGVYHATTFAVDDLTVQVILLDTRRFRSPLDKTEDPPRGTGPYAPHDDPSRTLLGVRQWEWLEAQLREPADVRLVVSGIQILPRAHRYERWDVFPHERARLLSTIAQTGAQGVVLLSGDRHFGSLYRETEGVPYPLWEITSSSLNKSFGGLPHEPAPRRVGDQVAVENVGVIDIDPAQRTLRLALANKQGRVQVEQILTLNQLRARPTPQ